MAKRKGAKSWRRSLAAHVRCKHSVGKERNFDLQLYTYHSDCIRAIGERRRVLSPEEKERIYKIAKKKTDFRPDVKSTLTLEKLHR